MSQGMLAEKSSPISCRGRAGVSFYARHFPTSQLREGDGGAYLLSVSVIFTFAADKEGQQPIYFPTEGKRRLGWPAFVPWPYSRLELKF